MEKIPMKKICVQCGREFDLTESEIAFYRKKNLQLPERCKKCREQNKKTRQETGGKKALPETGKSRNHAGGGGKSRTGLFASMLMLAVILIYMVVTGQLSSSDPQPGTGTSGTGYTLSKQASDGKFTDGIPTDYMFRTQEQLEDHFEKHGTEMGYKTPDAYLIGANRVIGAEDALHKLEKEDGDDVYYLEATNELVIVSGDGYIRTYFMPDDGIEYYNRQ